MNSSRNFLKKLIYRFLGPGFYQRAYIRGKLRDIKTGNIHEKEIEFLHYFIHSDSTVLDIGANYGHYTAIMSKLCPQGEVIAFEPVPFTFKVLSEIVHRLNIKHARLFHAAVSDQPGKLKMSVPLLEFGAPNTGIAHVVNHAPDKSTETVSVDALALDALNIRSVDFIKIDIEGHEPAAMRGMSSLIQNSRPVILIEFSHSCLSRAGSNPKEFATYLQEMKYTFFHISGEKLIQVPEGTPRDGYYFLIPGEKITQFNQICA